MSDGVWQLEPRERHLDLLLGKNCCPNKGGVGAVCVESGNDGEACSVEWVDGWGRGCTRT